MNRKLLLLCAVVLVSWALGFVSAQSPAMLVQMTPRQGQLLTLILDRADLVFTDEVNPPVYDALRELDHWRADLRSELSK